MKEKKLIFELPMAIGDALVFTSVLKDLHLNFPNMFLIDVHSYYPDIYDNNPHITKIKRSNKDVWRVEKITQGFIFINRNTWKHCSSIFNEAVSFSLFDAYDSIPQNSIYPEIYLTENEKSENILNRFGIKKPYWIINSSFKIDMPLKSWIPYKWKELVQELNKRNFSLVQTGSDTDVFENIPGTINLIGKTRNVRDFISLCHHSSGIITHVSFPVHVAAALNIPCIVICGGREHPWYSCYPNQQVIHTIGRVDCCFYDGCWKKQRSECEKLIGNPEYPLCMYMISVNEILLNVIK